MSEKTSETEKSKKRGHWSKEEHARFIQGIQLYGKNWKKVVECVGTRSSNQIRSHAQKYFLKLEKKNKLAGTPQNNENYLLYLQTLSYNAYLKFIYELHKIYSTRTTPLAPVKVLNGDEMMPEESTRKNLKVA
jgi:SHAQKYF class myb-like DNA-binding protein